MARAVSAFVSGLTYRDRMILFIVKGIILGDAKDFFINNYFHTLLQTQRSINLLILYILTTMPILFYNYKSS